MEARTRWIPWPAAGGRFLVVVAILALLQGLVLWIRQGYTMGEIAPPRHPLPELPMRLGEWTGTDVPQDPRLFGALQAIAAVNREYRDAAGNMVFVHMVWTDDYIRIHFPHQCYRETGWTETGITSTEVTGPDGRPARVPTVTFERAADRIEVLYWFQLGDRMFFDRIQHRALRQELCWGQKRWPPLVKLMLQTSADDPVRAQARLKEIALPVMAWLAEPAGGKEATVP